MKALVLRLFLRGLGGSYRYRVLHRDRLAPLLGSGTAAVVSFWHDQSFAGAWFLVDRLHGEGLPLTLLASRSRDGGLVAQVVHPWGLRVVRGSASRGGRQALLEMHRDIVRHGSSPLVLPDGPRGPAHLAKSGAVLLAKMSRAPILPLAFVPASCWRLSSWDRMLVPRPFTRVAVVVGEPLAVARETRSDEVEEARRRLERTLDELVEEGRRWLAPSTGREAE